MQTKVLIVAVVKKDGAILMRKKPAGSPPYAETWYIFGAEATSSVDPDQAVIDEVRSKSGITVSVKNNISWDTEVKNDLDGIEKIEWVKPEDLAPYDIVPPSRILFEKLGYIQ